MKSPLNFIILIFFIGCSAFSQKGVTGFNSSDFNSEQERLNVLSEFSFSQPGLNGNASINEQNAVIIQQIGDNNRVYSQTQSQSSKLELIQNGDFNNIQLEVNAPSINARIIQNGNNNAVLDNIYYTNLDVKLNAIQSGDNLTINRLGVNSLSNKLQLIQEGSSKTITVISN